jgi:succinylglutamate desuccinylase
MEVELAKQLEASVKNFFDAHHAGEKFHYDLHTAIRGSQYEKFAVHPFTNGKSYSQAQFAFHAACGIEAVLLSNQPATTFSYHSYAIHGAHAATVELGQVKPFGENDLTRLSAIHDSLVALLNKAELAEKSVEGMKLFEVIDVLTKDSDDYQLNIPSGLKNFTGFEAGFVLTESSLGQYVIEQEGDAIVFPNTQLPVGQRAGLVVRVKDWSEFQ